MRFLPKSFSLRGSVIFAVLLPLVGVFGLSGIAVLATLEQQLEQRLQDDIAVIARTLQAPLARSLERERPYSLDRAMRSASDFNRVYGVYVYDNEGEQVARADDDNASRDATLEELGVELQGTTTEYGSIGGQEVYSYFTPLTDVGGNAIGMLQVTRRVSEMQDYLGRVRTVATVAMVALGVFFVAIIVVGHHLVIGRPLGRLADAMARIGGGDTTARAGVSGPAEIRWLARRFNAMVDGLAERDDALARERTHQQQLEDRLRESEKYAFVGRLASGVAHELGGPLNVVDGHAQKLARDKQPGSSEHDRLTRIRESTSRMVAIVEQLLGFARESGDTMHEVSVSRLVSLAEADVRSQFDEHGATLEIAADAHDATISADENRMRHVLDNLLRNALYASDAGRVRAGWRSDGEAVRLFVENTGRPIPHEEHERIFEPFYTTKPAGVGSGLGLAIVRGTIADHGAEIRVYESELGGAGFEIVFPRGAESAA